MRVYDNRKQAVDVLKKRIANAVERGILQSDEHHFVDADVRIDRVEPCIDDPRVVQVEGRIAYRGGGTQYVTLDVHVKEVQG